MGYEGRYPTQEDTFLAEYVRDRLLNRAPDFEKMKEILRTGDGAPICSILPITNGHQRPILNFASTQTVLILF